MALINENFLKLQAGYLFPEIGKRRRAFQAAHPDAKIISMGIGDVTQPLAPAVIEAIRKAVEEMGRKETFHGYDDEGIGYKFLREAIRENDYIMVSRAMGASNLRIMMRHLLPNCFPPMIVLMTMQMGTMILAEAGLSFLGVGVEPPKAAWGAMVTDGYRYLFSNPILSFAPGLAVMLVVFAFNMVGDGLRDALDPRLRGRI